MDSDKTSYTVSMPLAASAVEQSRDKIFLHISNNLVDI